jgi:hypothetical protein
VIDDTVRCEADGALVTAVRVGVASPSGAPREEESAELRRSRERVALADSEVQRLRTALEKLAAAPVIEADPSDEPPAAWAAIVSARRELVTLRARREQTLREALATTLRELDEAQRALEIVVEREQRASTAKTARLHEVRKHADLDLAGAAGEVTVRVEYQVAAARWAPSYIARLDPEGRSESGPLHLGGSEARFELRAVVAQSSGEDWTDVALRLSTAEPERFALLPELHPQKIGRRQHEPVRRGFRAPPAGAAALYADYDRSFPSERSVTVEPPADEMPEELSLSEQVWDDETSRPRTPFAVPPAAPLAKKGRMIGAVGGAVAGTIAAPFALAAQAVSRNAPGGGGGEVRKERAAAIVSAPMPRLDYGNLTMGAPDSADRGTLVSARKALDGELATRIATSIAVIDGLPLPPGHYADWAHNYDYAFASDGAVDIASDAAWHSIALTARAGSAKLRHVAVPREQADVFRVASITNPFDGPLLPGPIDVYDRGQFLVTSEVDYTPPGGSVDIGLGVDPAVKIARNVEFHEEATGMLRGALRLVHAIAIDIENLASRPIDLEVRERVPVTREGDDDVEVTLGKIEPAWERFTPDTDAPRDERLRGGYRWQLTIPATSKQLLRAAYEIKIAGKYELVGGNRRES